ncbi:MAG TPA: hypothetical protein VGR57_19255 [Ktedonobacterales bacterium]|nr:hypothetical protein [Ktedonobacterales bacterium]
MATQQPTKGVSTPQSLQSATIPTENKLDEYARRGLWALPVWAALLFYGTLTHQPPPQTDFPGSARYISTTEFVIRHLVASIFGAGVGILGLTALFVVLCKGRRAPLALWALVTWVIGTALQTAVFGAAAFAQPAIGRAYLAGHMAEAVAINNDVYGPALFAAALPGTLLFLIGIVLFGLAVARSGSLPALAGITLVVAGVVFPVTAIVFDNFLESIGAALMVASTAWIAAAGWRTLRS